MSSSAPKKPDTLVIGAGLAGLSCAVRLHEAGHTVQVLESSDAVGGRVRTDQVDGFLLDRGFQVYLDAYPEAGKFLDLASLELQPFEPGALVWKGGKLRAIMDVFRRPTTLLSSALQPIGSVADKLRVAKLRFTLMRKPIDEIWSSPDQSTAAYLKNFGFSAQMIDHFFRSFYGGIFLEDQLLTSSRIFEFTFKMFALGSATLPARGMQAIPTQLADRLPEGTVRFNSPVDSVEGKTVSVAGEKLGANHLVIATDGETAHRLLPATPRPDWNSTACFYYAADHPPIDRPLIALKGDRGGLVNNVCVPSKVAPAYAPAGQSLVCASVLGDRHADAQLESDVRRELRDWFGHGVSSWRLLRMGTIRKALPVAPPGHGTARPATPPVYLCGDFTTSGSIEGAIISGLEIADQILANQPG